jgi:hypothetical protein
MMQNVISVCARTSSWKLAHVRDSLERELHVAMSQGVNGTQAHVGMLEMLQACSDELDRRAYVSPPPFRDISHEDGIRYSITVRVF